MPRKTLVGKYFPSNIPGGNDPRQLHKNVQTDVQTAYDLSNAPQTTYLTVTTTYAAKPTDHTLFCAGTTAYTVTLPTPTHADGKEFRLRNLQAVNAITVQAASGKIEGAASYSLAAGEAATFKSDDVGYWNVG